MKHRRPAIPNELQTIYYLSGRQNLSQNLRQKFRQLQRGFLGELAFHQLLKKQKFSSPTSLFSLTLQVGENLFQIDHLVIIGEVIYVHEIKHFKGDFHFKNNLFFSLQNNREIVSPIVQLKRAESLLRQLLSSLGLSYKVVSKVVFTHPECAIFTDNLQLPILLLPQVKRYIENTLIPDYSPTQHNIELAKKLVDLHQTETIFDQAIQVSYDHLEKGINCPRCMSKMRRNTQRTVICTNCSYLMNNEQAIVFNLRQLQHLFPQKKLTTALGVDWFGGEYSYFLVKKVLDQYFM